MSETWELFVLTLVVGLGGPFILERLLRLVNAFFEFLGGRPK